MTVRLLLGFLIITSIFSGCSNSESTGAREYVDLNADWKFIRDTTGENLFEESIDDSPWETVFLPHTPKLEPLVVNNQWQGIAWYRKHIYLDNNPAKEKIFLKIGAAMQIADVWLNGKYLGTHLGGYLPFGFDISEVVHSGDNILTVRLDNRDNRQIPPGKPLDSLDFNLYGGLYRDVALIITGKTYIEDNSCKKDNSGGLLITYDSVSNANAIIVIKTPVINEYERSETFQLRNILLDAEGKTVALTSDSTIILKPNDKKEIRQILRHKNPKLWHPDFPYLYKLKTVLLADGKIIDEIQTSVGIRKVELKKDGFYLNGNKFFINGTNRHQEYPYIGYALSDEAQYRDAVKIKNAGFDFVRCSHYPQSEAFLDACDRLGLLVMDCIPGWQFMGNDTFRTNSLNDCRNLILRDRNHASVIFWELSLNESSMDDSYIRAANQILDDELSSEALSAGWIDNDAYDLFIPARQHATPPDYWNNYRVGERVVFIAEYGDWEYYAQNAGFCQAGFYNLEPEERTSRQPRNAGEKGLLQQALNYQEAVNSNLAGRSTIGHANWLMYDYNRGYADDIESSGISDIFRIPKFSYYFYQSQRPPYPLSIEDVESGPMVYIASYWLPQSSLDIRVFSNCDEVELYMNGLLIERKGHDHNEISANLKYPPFTFRLKEFEPGILKAIAYIDGNCVASDSVITPGNPTKLELSCDLSNIELNHAGKDMVFVHASVIDSNKTLCPINDVKVRFELDGDGYLIGQNPVKTEAGIASILLVTMPGFKQTRIIATAESLESTELIIK